MDPSCRLPSLDGSMPIRGHRTDSCLKMPVLRARMADIFKQEIGRAHVCTPVTFLYFVCRLFFVNDTATTEISTLSLHDALPIYADTWPSHRLLFEDARASRADGGHLQTRDRKSTRLYSSHIPLFRLPSLFC